MNSNLFKSTVNEYLEGLPKAIQQKLYELPATCLSIYRLLPPMAKFYIMLMVFNERPVLLRDLDKWNKPQSRVVLFESLKRLKSLHLIEEDATNSHIRLNQTFRKNFRDCLTGTQTTNAFGNLCTTEDSFPVDLKFLDAFALQKWESILHFMVGTESARTPSKLVLSLLRSGGLMEGSTHNLAITNTGFQFLLQDVNAQIWILLLQYLNLTQDLHMDPVDVLNFIFILGSLELGKSYTVSSLSATQVSMLADLKDYGLVYQRSDSLERFYPTRLATTLTSDSAALKTPSMAVDQVLGDDNANHASQAQQQHGSIIIETNFKLYAYTSLPLEIAVLNLFVQMKTRFANMVCGQITRELIRNALYNGITAVQIIKFLETNAHPQMRALARERLDKKIEFDTNHNINTAGGAPQSKAANGVVEQHRLEILPPTVVDQIKLWQLELDRIQTYDGYLFKDFLSQQEFDILAGYAVEVGVLIWLDKVKRKFFVTQLGFSQVVDFANRKLKK